MLINTLRKLRNILLILFGLLILILAGFGFYFKSNIVPFIKENLNEQLDVPVEVKNISFSGFKTFPRLGVELSEIEIKESTVYYNKPSIKADKIYLLLDVTKLLGGSYEISRVEVEGAELMLADVAGGNNYTFFKLSESNSESVSFVINQLILRNTSIVYNNAPSDFMAKCFTPTSTLRVNNNDFYTALKINGILNNTTIVQDSEAYINKRNVSIKTLLSVDTQKELISFNNGTLGIEDVELTTDGQILYSAQEKLHIRFSSRQGKTQDLISLLPPSLKASFDEISIAGNSTLNGVLSGSYSSSNELSFKLNYRLEDTEIELIGQPYTLQNIGANGTLDLPSLGDFRKAMFKANISQAETTGNHFSGKLLVTDFDNPKVDWRGRLDIDAPFLFNTSNQPPFKCTDGRLTYQGSIILNQISKNPTNLKNDLILNGSLEIDGIQGIFTDENLEVKGLSGRCKATPTAIEVEDIFLELAPETSFRMNGKLVNYISLFTNETSALLVGDLEVNNFNINDFTSSDSASGKEGDAKLSPISFKLTTEINNLTYNDFKAKHFKGTLTSNQQSIVAENAEIQALEGVTNADLAIKPWGDYILLDIVSSVDGLDITQLFKQFNNFEQNEITYEHLSGVLNGKITAKIILDKDYNPMLDKLYVKSDVEVINGALTNYKPLQELSKFVDIDDLMNVQFEQLRNTIEIFDATIFIPKMEIKNSALNLELEGTHTFENQMKYHIGLSVGDLLAKKANWLAKRREQRIENNPDGGMTAYIIMEGTPDDLSIRYDKATVKETAKEELKKERENFMKALKGEEVFEKKKDYGNVWDE